eukprot:TRINITY_DN5286_c1_g2_i2.p1 TRINITY_DN5286_c1_g2~~TRINITY_DN5286_c1_g2_i2.p1  ORF type:complete len:172 (+),score=46.69 TRINITY_DN5286_c1_g2_i2:117-632(+)
MATLTITTNTKNPGEEKLNELMLKLSEKVSKAIQFPEEQLLIEMKTETAIVFRGSAEPAAHCFWSFGGYFKKAQNLDLRDCICDFLSSKLQISASRVRITRVQLYEILEKGGNGSNPNSFIDNDSESDQYQKEGTLKNAFNKFKKVFSPNENNDVNNENNNVIDTSSDDQK